MIIALDVQYRPQDAVVAGILFSTWTTAEIQQYCLKTVSDVAPYEPGSFYKRELPCLLALLQDLDPLPETIVVDGFVTLGAERKKGLGMHLYESLSGRAVVLGVAKNAYPETPAECAIHRGNSSKPLFVTAAGMDLATAKSCIVSMHGCHRNPTLLKKVDQLCRGIISV